MKNDPRKMVGDGKLPNKYWVTLHEDWQEQSRDGDIDSGRALHNLPDGKSKLVGCFSSFEQAEKAMYGAAKECIEPTTPEGFHTARMEDRLSGIIYEGGYFVYHAKTFLGDTTKIEWEWNDDTKCTRQVLGGKFK